MLLIGSKLLTRCSLLTRSLPVCSPLHHIQISPWRGFSEATQGALSSTIFVGRLPPDASEEELRTHFPGCVAARIIKDKFSGISKGFGYVDFHSYEDATEAISSPVVIHGRQIVLDMAESLRSPEISSHSDVPTSTLFVGRIPYSLTKEELMELFPGCTSARIISDPSTGYSKGYGFVVYPTVEEAQEALKYNGLAIRGQRLNVNMASTTQSLEGDDDTPRRGSSEPSPTLFVKNLWYNTSEADLKAKFKSCIKVRIPVEQDSDRNRGFGYVEFANVEDAQNVFDSPENIELDGRVLYIDYGSDPKFDESERGEMFDGVRRGTSKPSSRLFIRNLWYGTTEEDLKEKFAGCRRVNIPVDPMSGSNKGYGFVEYNSVAEAQSVFDNPENVELDGRVLYIDYSTAHETINEATAIDDGTVRRGSSDPSSTLFLQNLLFETTEDDLKKAFDGCVKAKIAIDPSTGRSRGFGFVEYATVDEAKAVFDKEENVILDGRVIYIDYATRGIDEKPHDLTTRGNGIPSSTLFVKNLWYGTTEEALKTAFSGCVTVRIPIDLATGKNKGYGFVEYESVADAQSVFDKEENIELDGYTLFLDFAAKRSNVGYGGWEKDLELDESSFYEGVRPVKQNVTGTEQQDSVDDPDVVMEKSEDVK